MVQLNTIIVFNNFATSNTLFCGSRFETVRYWQTHTSMLDTVQTHTSLLDTGRHIQACSTDKYSLQNNQKYLFGTGGNNNNVYTV